MKKGTSTLRLVAWELTRQCPLRCRHCRASATARPWEDELTTEEAFRLLRSWAEGDRPIVILTGGEPLARPDIWDIVAFGTKLGLRLVMAPCGAHFDGETVEKLKSTGIKRISLSIDGATAASHDAFRGVDGAFQQVLTAARLAREGGLPFQVNTTIVRQNIDELPDIVNLAERLGAAAFHPFLLVPTGRAKAMEGLEVSAERYEEVLRWFLRESEGWSFPVKPTCAPHYYRILRQEGGRPSQPPAGQGGHPFDRALGGCLGGRAFGFVSWRGDVQICGFLDISAGSLRDTDMDFWSIWNSSPFLKQIRDVDGYHGRCGVCEFRFVCGGCRARAHAIRGDFLGDDPACSWEPRTTS